MLLMFPFFLILGLFLPGFFIARYSRHTLWGASAFTISLLILFHSVFWLGIFHAPIRLWTVLPCLIAASAGAAWLQRRSVIPAKTAETMPAPQLAKRDWILLLSSGFVGVVLLARSGISPLIGYDTQSRWDFLAQWLLALGKFDFYPPLTPADFRIYFWVDGFPPLVSFTHWWLYASAGRYLPSLICIFVAAQFACTLAFTYGAASALFSRRAGVLAAAMLAACPLFFKAVVLGTETGLTALSIAATIYFVVTARRPVDVRAMVSAGLAAALGALLREYGWIALIAGAIALLWRRQALKQVFVFAAVAIAVAAPWYARTWILSGNPFYSLRLGNFPVNPILDGLLQYYKSVLGKELWTIGTWVHLWLFFLYSAPLQVLAGIPGGFRRFRQHGYLIVIALLLSAVWIQSVGYTSGGLVISTRVLSPTMVVLSITAAGILEPLTRRARWHAMIVVVVVLCQIWTAAHGVLYPYTPLINLRLSQWPQHAFDRLAAVPGESELRDQLLKILPAGCRVLSDNPSLHAGFINRGSSKGIEVVPVWSPEVRFIFSLSPEESERRLLSLRIGSVAVYDTSLNTGYLLSASPFYASLPRRWRVLARTPDSSLLFMIPRIP
jgi:hypothetical protein